MQQVDFNEFWDKIERRARELGFLTPEMTDRMRNKGERRTPEKRELLQRIASHAREAGIEPLKAFF